MKQKKIFLFIVIAAIVVVIDQVSKFFARVYLTEKISIIPNILWFNYATNTGAGFSILQDQNLLLIFISLIVIGLILYFYTDFKKVNTAIAVVFGGVIGNLIDRIIFGRVSDFIDFKIWPNFNIADGCITVGITIIVIYYIFLEKKRK